MSKTVLVTGADGQDGSLMVDHILKTTDYEVWGTVHSPRIAHGYLSEALNNARFQIIGLDITDQQKVSNLVSVVRPDYYLNFAAQTNVFLSKEIPDHTFQANYLAVVYALKALEVQSMYKEVRFFNAGSSEEFSPADYFPQNEKHPRRSNNPYGISKVLSHALIEQYRSEGFFAIQPYLYNHIGPRSNQKFLPKKVARYIALMRLTWNPKDPYQGPCLQVGNLETTRDWADAQEVVEAIWLALNADTPKDYVISSGQSTSVKNLIDNTFEISGQDVGADWIDNKFITRNHGSVLVETLPDLIRPSEEVALLGDASVIHTDLKWKACKPLYSTMQGMVQAELGYMLDRMHKRK